MRNLFILLILLALTGCGKHGTYTQAFLDQAEEDRLKMRGAMKYDTAVQQFESGDLELALQSANATIGISPDNPNGYRILGRILLEKGMAYPASAAFKHGEELNPHDPKLAYFHGIAFERLSLNEDALAAYRRASVADPTSVPYMLAIAEVLVELDRLAEARTFLEQTERYFDSSPAFRQMLGHIALLQDNLDDAVRFLTEATILSPRDPVLAEDLCYAQIAAGQFARAEATLRRLDAEGPKAYAKRRDLHHLHAACLIELDRPVEARTILYAIVRTKDGAKDLDAWVKLIDVALAMRDDDHLLTVAFRLMSIAPARHEGYLAMALWQQRRGDHAGALRSIDRAIKRAGDNPAPLHLRDKLVQINHIDGAG